MLDTRHTWSLMVLVDRSPAQMAMKHHPPEFQAEAVALYRSRPGATVKSVADDLGIDAETPRNWIRIDDRRRTGSPASAR
jgi:transposase